MTFKNGTATSGEDYSDKQKQVSIQSSIQRTTCADIDIMQDSKYEGNENFTVVLMLNNNPNVQIADGEATVTIIDDEGNKYCMEDGISFCKAFFKKLVTRGKWTKWS